MLLSVNNPIKTGIDTALNNTNWKISITEMAMNTKRIMIQYCKLVMHVLVDLLAVRAGLYVKQERPSAKK
ncbi:hypothetical protein AYL20_15005 [Acinetobacter venetianus]|nr:hypothetical protein AYL20_15005 [Acinetobacter venetianus]